MEDKTESRKRARKYDRQEREERLLAAAARIFAEKGFEDSTTREIASEAGCAEGLIHRYFGGKSGLLHAIVSGKGQNPLEEKVELPRCDSLLAEVEQLVQWEIERAWRVRNFLRVAFRQALVEGGLAKTVREGLFRRRMEMYRTCLERHLPEIAPRHRLNLAQAADVLISCGFALGFVRRTVLRNTDGLEQELGQFAARAIARYLVEG